MLGDYLPSMTSLDDVRVRTRERRNWALPSPPVALLIADERYNTLAINRGLIAFPLFLGFKIGYFLTKLVTVFKHVLYCSRLSHSS